MLIHHGLQVAPLTPLRSGGLSVPTPLSQLPPRELLGRRFFLARSGDAALPLACLCLPHARYSCPDLNICKCHNGPPRQRKLPPPAAPRFSPSQSPLPPVSLHFPRSFSFLSLPRAAASSAMWADGCGNQICFVTQIYLKEE